MLLDLLISKLELLRWQHNRHEMTPFRLTSILPRMHGYSLQNNVALFHDPRFANVELQLYSSFDADCKVYRERLVEMLPVARRDVKVATHSAVWMHQSEISRGDNFVTKSNVCFTAKLDLSSQAKELCGFWRMVCLSVAEINRTFVRHEHICSRHISVIADRPV